MHLCYDVTAPVVNIVHRKTCRKIPDTGLEVYKRCQHLGLRRPEFRQDENFLSILWRKNTGRDGETGQVIGHVTGTVKHIVS